MILRILLLIAFLLSSSSAWATDWCDDANTSGCWTTETGSGTTLDDISSNSHDGTFKGAGEPAWSATVPTSATDGFQGTSTYSVLFDGTDDKITVANHADFNYTTGTFCFWLYAESNSNNPSVLSKHSSNGSRSGIHVYLSGGQIVFQIKKDGNAPQPYTSPNEAISLDTWHHVCGSFAPNGSECSFTFDGITKDSANAAYDWAFSTEDLLMADSPDSFWGELDGNLDEIIWYAQAQLDSTDINDIMDNGLVQATAPTITRLYNATIHSATMYGITQ